MAETNVSESNNLWELYGVKTDPFSTSPLLVKGGIIPIESFYGREEEIKRISKWLYSNSGGRILVCGDTGVGKTSFVNYVRFRAQEKGYFTPFKEIGVQNNWNSDTFILNTLFGIYSTIKLSQENKLLSSESHNKLKNLVELTTTEIEGLGANVLGVGGNITWQNKSAQRITNLSLQDLFSKIALEIKNKTNKDLIVHYNNLERLEESKLINLFEDLRDFFQMPHVQFVLVGNLTVQSTFMKIPRFNSILADTPIVLETLSYEDVLKIIELRFKHLEIKGLQAINPISKDALKLVYSLYEGNIRNILNSLSTAVVELTNERTIIFDAHLLAGTLKNIAEKRYLEKLSEKPKELLNKILAEGEITNKQLSQLTNTAPSNVSKYIKQLLDSGSIYLKRIDGKDKYWDADAKIKWALLKSLEIKPQK